MEDLWVHFLAKLHHYEPVTEPEVLHNRHDVVAAAGLGTAAENQISRIPEKQIKIITSRIWQNLWPIKSNGIHSKLSFLHRLSMHLFVKLTLRR